MTNYDFIDKFIATTDANTNKNYSSGVFAFSVPSTSVNALDYAVRQFSVPLSTDTRSYSLIVNMSDLDNRYYPIDNYDRSESAGSGMRSRSTVVTASNGTAIVSLYYSFNAFSGSTTFPAFTLNVIRRDFVDEF